MIPNIRTLIVGCFVGFVANWQFGYQITYVNTSAESFLRLAQQKPNNNIKDWNRIWSLVVSSFYPGTFLGFLMVPHLIEKNGVRKSFLYSSIPALLGCFILLFVGEALRHSVQLFLVLAMVGRFLVGVQSGCCLCLLPLHYQETSDHSHREFLSALQQVCQAISTFIGILAGSLNWPGTDCDKILYLQVIGLLPTIFTVLFFEMAPDTPRFIYCHGFGYADVKSTLEESARFYQGNYGERVIHELNQLPQNDFSERDKSSFGDQAKGTIVGIVAGISFAFTGDDLIDSYSAEVLYSSDRAGNAQHIPISTLLALLLVLSSVGGVFLLDRFGNRRLLIGGLVGTACSNGVAAAGSLLGCWQATALGFGLTKTFIGLGAGAPAWFLASELVPAGRAHLAQTLATGCLLSTVGLLAACFLPLFQRLGGLALLLLASGPACACALLLYLLLPETQGLRSGQVRPLLQARLLSGLRPRTPLLPSYGSLSTDFCEDCSKSEAAAFDFAAD